MGPVYAFIWLQSQPLSVCSLKAFRPWHLPQGELLLEPLLAGLFYRYGRKFAILLWEKSWERG